MNYGGFEVFKTYLAVKNHFTSDYDYHKYGGRVTAKLESFTKRSDRYFFHKLSKRYAERDILDYFVSNFAVNSSKWIGNVINNEGAENYTKFRKYKESFEYNFRNDCVAIRNELDKKSLSFNDGFLVDSGQHPRVLRLLLRKKIHLQTAIILDSILSFSKVWDKEITEKVVWPKIKHTFKKLQPFLTYNETQVKLIIKEIFVNDN
jgi:hypothetical protein